MQSRRVSRRAFLRGMAGVGAALLAGTLPLVGCSRERPREPGFKLRFLTADEYRTVSLVVDRMVPGLGAAPPGTSLGVARQADELLERLSPPLQQQFRELLGAFAGLPVLALAWRPFSAQDDAGARGYLEAWERSPVPQMRRGFHGLRRLASGVYYADPRAWAAIGYEGTWIGKADFGYGLDNQGWGDLVNPHVYERFA